MWLAARMMNSGCRQFNRNYFELRGINLVHVFTIKNLPVSVQELLARSCNHLNRSQQVLLLGNGGGQFWETLNQQKITAEDPIDTFVEDLLRQFFAEERVAYQILYPGPCNIDLQHFGKLAGWHTDTPFLLGLHPNWGTWFAYRALVVLDANYTESALPVSNKHSACERCNDKPCQRRCPANAVLSSHFSLEACVAYRMQENSACGYTCLAREACPHAKQHQYSREQMTYHYGESLKTIKRYRC